MTKRKKHITQKLTNIPQKKRYTPLEKGEWNFISFDLTQEQQFFIDDVAKINNISHNEAFKIVFNDAFKLLIMTQDRRKTYESLPSLSRSYQNTRR